MVTITYDHLWVYILFFLISLYILLKYEKEFNINDLLNYTIFLVTKIILFFITLSLLLLIIGNLSGFDVSRINGFQQDSIYSILYYVMINYGSLYFLKLCIYLGKIYKGGDFGKFKLTMEEKKEK